jgi:hypothetical protein
MIDQANFEALAFRIWPTNSDPNYVYREWLESHVGIQGVDWDWRIRSFVSNGFEIYFRDKLHATLFELTWP